MGIFDRRQSRSRDIPGATLIEGDYTPDLPGHPAAIEAVTAAVGPLLKAGRRKTWTAGPRANWEEMLRDFDRNGPSFLGFYLDLVSEFGAMCDLEHQTWDAKKGWVRREEGAVDLRSIRGVYGQDLAAIVASMIRKFELPGEMAWIPVDIPLDPSDPDSETEVRIMVRSLWTIEDKKRNGARILIVRDDPDLRPGEDGYWVIPEEQAHRLWRPDDDYPLRHWTPLQRGISELRTHRNIGRTISRSAASKLLNADIFWIQGEARDLAVLPRNDGAGQNPGEGRRLGYLGVVIQKMIAAAKENLDDIREEKVAAAFPHPLVTPNEPKRVEVGRPYDPEAIAAKRDAMEDFARGQNIPMSVLVEGQGAARRLLNEIKQDSAFKETSIFPKLARVCNAITGAWLRPMLTDGGMDPGLVANERIWFTKSALEPEGGPKEIGDAVKAGVLERRAWAEALGRGDYLLDLPDGVTEMEFFLTLRGTQTVFGELEQTMDDLRDRMTRAGEDATMAAATWWE